MAKQMINLTKSGIRDLRYIVTHLDDANRAATAITEVQLPDTIPELAEAVARHTGMGASAVDRMMRMFVNFQRITQRMVLTPDALYDLLTDAVDKNDAWRNGEREEWTSSRTKVIDLLRKFDSTNPL